MPTGIFEFQTMLTSAVNGISGTLLGTEQSVSYVLMTICLVLGIYEAYTKGGDLRSLAGTLLKYAVAAFLIGNWTAFFSDAYSGFNQLASAIDSSYGGIDLAGDWTLQLEHLFQANGYGAMFKAIPWTPSALITLLEIVLAYLIYPIAVQIFALIYAFWGTCLFAMGPFVIALAPSSLVNSLTKYYALNLGIWNAWSIIYAVFGCLITAIHANDVNAILNGDLGSFGLGPTLGATGPLDGGIETIGLISIMYAIRCRPQLNVVYQQQAKAWKIRGEESGGAVEILGHYVGFIGVDGSAVPWLQRVQNFLPNGMHAVIVGDEFVRVEMFRFEKTYDLLITRHWLERQDGRRAEMRSAILFLGRNGFLETELWGKDAAFRGGAMPHFLTRSGEPGPPSPLWMDAALKVTEAVCCCGCRHSHLLEVSPAPSVPEVPACQR